ncbi:hypothetical protein CMI37_07595 [Candidatus Pacearchaeota archaeon]|nr:hypothetical protein [Candidatus Pacearchaeota archaeon]
MLTPLDEKVLERYLKVKALWEGTQGPEKAAAARVMSAFQNNYPGIDQLAEKPEIRERVERMPSPSLSQAMADAVGILAGFSNPFDVISRYAAFLDSAEAEPLRRLETPDEAAAFLAEIAKVGAFDSVRGLRVVLELDPAAARVLADYAAGRPSDEALVRVAHRAGDLAGRTFFALLKKWRADQ